MQKLFCVLILLCSAGSQISCNTKQAERKKTNAVETTSEQTTAPVYQQEDPINFKDHNNLFTSLNTQRYRVSAGKTAVITADKGLRIKVDASVLEKENGGDVEGEIQVEIIELTNAGELFRANATTTSNGKLLASGGCYYIGMFSGGSKLTIKKGRSLQVEFPVLKEAEMELFYAERDAADNLNWQRAGFPLQSNPVENDNLVFNESGYDAPPVMPGLLSNEKGEAIVYHNLKKRVFLNDRMMTVQELIDTVNKEGIKIIVDTVKPWPKFSAAQLAMGRVDTNYLLMVFGPEKQFVLKTIEQVKKEKLFKEEAEKQKKEAVDKWEPKSLAGVLQKYYSPAPVSRLGWINCDRFYNAPMDEEIELSLPITFNGAKMQYFLLYTSLNGCMKGEAVVDGDGKMMLQKQPAGTSLTIVAFTKMDGEIYHCTKTIVTGRSRHLALQPTLISITSFNKMFGRNVKT